MVIFWTLLNTKALAKNDHDNCLLMSRRHLTSNIDKISYQKNEERVSLSEKKSLFFLLPRFCLVEMFS